MKVAAIVLLCALAAVQGRSAVISKNTKAPAILGQNPHIVHLRLAVSTTGALNTCGGSFIGDSWVLTAASCLNNARFIWIRLGMVHVIRPEMVLETTAIRTNPSYSFGLVTANRIIQTTVNIAPVTLGGFVPQRTNLCLFGADGNVPGERLNCFDVSVEQTSHDDIRVQSAEVSFSVFDYGAPLVANNVQIGVLLSSSGNTGNFVYLGSEALEWIGATTSSASPSSIRIASSV